MKTTTAIMMGRSRQIPLSALWLVGSLLIAAVGIAANADTAWIAGKVVDNTNGQVLRGAAIQVEGTNLETVSDLQGDFLLTNVPAGHRTLVVTYLGTADLRYAIDVATSQHLTLTLGLGGQVTTMEQFTVLSLREGQAKALNQQKNSDTVVNIIGADSIGRFPDPNTAEALQRVVGVSLELDTGEGRYINVRGVSSEYNSVTSDGQQVLSNNPGSRTVNLNVIPSNQISQIEVIKSKTPDMIADGIGGSVKLVNKSALDTDHHILQGSVSLGRLQYNGRSIFDISAAGGLQFGPEKKYGILVSGGYSR